MPDPDFNPLDMPDVEDLEDETSGGFDPLDMPEVAPHEETAPREWWEDLGVAGLDGITLNNAAELGHIGEDIGNSLADIAENTWGTHEIDGMPPIKTGESDLDLEELYALARESGAGKIGHTAGLINTGVAMSGRAPTSVSGQVAAGALSGGLSTGGDTGYDPASTVAGAATGGALGGLGGALGKGAEAIRRWLGGAGPEAAQMALPGMAPKVATNAERLAEKLALSLDDVTRPATASSKVVGQAALKAAQSPLASPDMLRSAGGALAAGGPQTMTPLLGASKASAQDSRPFTEVELRKPEPWQVEIGDARIQTWRPEIGEAKIREKAYAGQPAMIYSVQSVLSSGDSGLPANAERDLTSALLAGDEGKIDAVNFKLMQRFPGYAKRLQEQLTSLSEETP
jgi:hypothetical protein